MVEINVSDSWPETGRTSGYDLTFQFDEVLNAQDDLGFVGDGSTLNDAEFSDLFNGSGKSVLVEFDPGTYRFSKSGLGSDNSWSGTLGLRGLGDDPTDVKIGPEAGSLWLRDNDDAILYNVGNWYVENLAFDHNDALDTGAYWHRNDMAGDIYMERTHLVGHDPGTTFVRLQAPNERTAVFKDCEKRGPATKTNIYEGRWGSFIDGSGDHYRIFLDGCYIEHTTENGVYAGGQDEGAVHMKDTTFYNCGPTTTRVANEHSSMVRVTIKHDLTDDGWNPNNRNLEDGADSEDAKWAEMNRLSFVQRTTDRAATGPAYFKGCRWEVVESGITDSAGDGGFSRAIYVSSNASLPIMEDCEVYYRSTLTESGSGVIYAPGADAREAGDVSGLDVVIEDGAGDGPGPIFWPINSSETINLTGSCLYSPQGIDGVWADDSPVNVEDTRVSVGGTALVERNGGTITSSGIETSGECPRNTDDETEPTGSLSGIRRALGADRVAIGADRVNVGGNPSASWAHVTTLDHSQLVYAYGVAIGDSIVAYTDADGDVGVFDVGNDDGTGWTETEYVSTTDTPAGRGMHMDGTSGISRSGGTTTLTR